ncbi:Hypothetical protein TR210_1298 [Trichococcus ilyis]|uniref:Uncharacterized protein n=1 Tax=Trichococcus ilyis TaxID=640938 RepID=A0A143YNY3_9LACT|nr:Hypothetical protein TR210_1298 [Trichococcus ilyis]
MDFLSVFIFPGADWLEKMDSINLFIFIAA